MLKVVGLWNFCILLHSMKASKRIETRPILNFLTILMRCSVQDLYRPMHYLKHKQKNRTLILFVDLVSLWNFFSRSGRLTHTDISGLVVELF
jgi:hypothetical protein